jgi:hypothetical protein
LHFIEDDKEEDIEKLKKSLQSCEKIDSVEFSKEHLTLLESIKEMDKEFIDIQKIPKEKGFS